MDFEIQQAKFIPSTNEIQVFPKNTQGQPAYDYTGTGKYVKMLSIQGNTGTKFKLNNGGEIQMEFEGVYELDLHDVGGEINTIEITNSTAEVTITMVIEGGTTNGSNT